MNITDIKISPNARARLCVAGHVGVGHVHSHSGFTQDDSAGFAVAASIINAALKADTTIESVAISEDGESVSVKTREGGLGSAKARRGFTPMEAELMQRAVGEDGIFSQAVAVKAFGRMYGQGVMESAVAFQAAVALAVMDSLAKRSGGAMKTADANEPGKLDRFAGIVLNVGGVSCAFLLTINATSGGIGPDEDHEGNTMLGAKGELMRSLGIDGAPAIVLESKAYIPSIAPELNEPTFFVRAQNEVDSALIARLLIGACDELGLARRFDDSVLPQSKGQLREATIGFANGLIRLAEELKSAETALEKVRILAELSKLISEDAGGVTFMSNAVHEVMRGVGMVPGTSAVLSLLVTKDDFTRWRVPMLTAEDAAAYSKIVLRAIKLYSKEGDQ